jgi:hypothetical protein
MKPISSTNRRLGSRFFLIATFVGLSSGCGGGPVASGGGPFGRPQESRLLAPFAGEWAFDFESTLAAQKAAGASEEEIDRWRKLYADNPQFGQMHPDMKITGTEAVCSGIPASEYRFFAIHEHAGKICGKAWHHEDRFDPGDMSKCYVRLQIKDIRLHLEVKMKDGLPDLNDPDLTSTPPAELDSADNCDADNPPGSDWGEWTTFVFARKPK